LRRSLLPSAFARSSHGLSNFSSRCNHEVSICEPRASGGGALFNGSSQLGPLRGFGSDQESFRRIASRARTRSTEKAPPKRCPALRSRRSEDLIKQFRPRRRAPVFACHRGGIGKRMETDHRGLWLSPSRCGRWFALLRANSDSILSMPAAAVSWPNRKRSKLLFLFHPATPGSFLCLRRDQVRRVAVRREVGSFTSKSRPKTGSPRPGLA